MSITIANKTSGTDADGNTTAVTASQTPAANKLQLLRVSSRTGITADPNQPTATGNGLTWVVDTNGSVVFDTTSSSRKRITVFRAMGASPTTGAVTIDFGGQNQTDVEWTLDEVTGMDTSGTNGSGAIVQVINRIDETEPTPATLIVTLAAFGSANNATYGAFAFGTGGGDVLSAGTGFTELAHTSGASLIGISEWRVDNDTTVDATDSVVGGEIGGIAIEIRAAVVASTSHLLSLLGVGK